MSKVSNFIFNLSPRKLAVYLVIGPLVYFLVYLIASILIRNITETTETSQAINTIFLVAELLFLVITFALCLFWLRSVVYAVKDSDLGIARRWFNIAFVALIVYLLYNLRFLGFDYIPEAYRHYFSYVNEFIGFGGLLIAYPTICHYAARAIHAKTRDIPSSFLKALPITLLLIFGTVLVIPFLHKTFSTKTSTNAEIIKIYGIGLGLFAVLLIVSFMAAITGLV